MAHMGSEKEFGEFLRERTYCLRDKRYAKDTVVRGPF